MSFAFLLFWPALVLLIIGIIMAGRKRPVAVRIVGWLFIIACVGVIGYLAILMTWMLGHR